MGDNTKRDYTTAVDERVLAFVAEVSEKGAKGVKPIDIAVINRAHADRLKELTGIDYNGYKIVLTGDTVAHIQNRHGVNGAADNSMSDPNDIARIGWVVNNFDKAEYAGTTGAFSNNDGTPSSVVLLSKRVNGFHYVAEAVPVTKNKTVYIRSVYKNDA